MGRLVAAAVAAGAFAVLGGATCLPPPTPSIHYPYSGVDATPPALELSTSDLSGNLGAHAVNQVAGQPVTSIQGGTLDMSHTAMSGPPAVPGGPPTPAPDQRSVLVWGTASDPESGIHKFRVRGKYEACDDQGTLVDYKGDHTYYAEDLTAGGATTVPASRGFTVTVPIYPLLHPLKDPADPAAGRKDGTSGWFEFQLEAYNGASQLPTWTKTIVYSVGTVACP